MLLIDNINFLRQNFPQTLDKLKAIEKEMDSNLLEVKETRRGTKTLIVKKDDKPVCFHSKYNPEREADAIIDGYKNVGEKTNVIFYGIGLGYHIDAFLDQYPNVNYYIYEPIPEIIYTYLSNKSLRELPSENLKGIVIGTDEQEMAQFLIRLIDRNKGQTLLAELPIHKQVFAEEYEGFLKLFKNIVKEKRSGLHTDYAFQKRWIINSMKNFGDILSTPNIILEKKGEFKDKPAILVAAGPSLNEEIENVRYIKENGLAYIFSVGSSINTLIHHNIYPDAACTYDPTEHNQKVFIKVKEEGIKDIPMIFGSSVGYETLENYPGEKYHMITSQDTISKYYLKTYDDDKIDIVSDAPSIAVVTMQLLYTLGFNPVILVGQNLAYRGKERYSEGISYSKEVSKQEMEKGIWVKDVYGNEVLTNEGFNRMRNQMEHYIKNFSDLIVINTTKGGAHIEGAEFVELEEVMREYLEEKVVDENWLDGDKVGYDKEYLRERAERMDRSLNRAQKLIQEYHETLDNIDRMILNGNFNEVEKTYQRLDKTLRKIETNTFFKIFILPMNRVNYKILADSIDSLNEEKNPMEKGKRIVSSFKRFMDFCRKDMKMIEPVYEDMKEKIEYYQG